MDLKSLRSFFATKETPFYYYDLELLQQTLEALRAANRYGYHIHYALKANNNPPILKQIRKAGLGIDCVSGNEVKIGIENAFTPDQIVLAGVGKTDREIVYAIEKGIFSFNVESIQELQVINEHAERKNKRAAVSIRINPAIEAGTHHYITTGSRENKFGISTEELLANLDLIQSLPHIDFIGLHYHIGSQISDMQRFRRLCERVNELQTELIAKGIHLPHLNVGGGLGIDYEQPEVNPIPDFETYFKVFHDHLRLPEGQQLHFELGRAIVGQCGVLISRVLYVKAHEHSRFVILDAGMTDLMRPALYQAVHKLENLTSLSSDQLAYDVVGPVCESSDSFGKAVLLPITERGDFFAIKSTGAYGETMKNAYNARDLAPAYYSTELTN